MNENDVRSWGMNHESYASRIVYLVFGGMKSFCEKTSHPTTTVQYWVKQGRIPEKHRAGIIRAAREHDLLLDGKRLEPTDFVDQVAS